MEYSMGLNWWIWVAAALPLGVLLWALLIAQYRATKAGMLSWVIALIGGYLIFGSTPLGLVTACIKGLSLTVYVVLIIWASVYLYNVIQELGAVEVIAGAMSRTVADRLARGLLLGWCFSAFVQGFAGFGVPVAVVAPLMAATGFSPAVAAAATLVGHAWSISFGSMAASYYTIQLVTSIPGGDIRHWMGIMLGLPAVLSGLAVAHIVGGPGSAWRSLPTVLGVGSMMALTQWGVAVVGAPPVATMMAGLVGCAAMVAISERASSSDASSGQGLQEPYGFHMAFSPYYAVITLTLLVQTPWVKRAVGWIKWGVSLPGTVTSRGFEVAAVKDYAAIGPFTHPAPLILMGLALGIWAFRRKGYWVPGTAQSALTRTVRQCVPATISIATMVMMALVMNDTGMTTILAHGAALAAGSMFPVISPFIGVLGSFMTGSNTNSNVLFGLFQVQTASRLGISTHIIAATQSAGGALGSSIAPAKVLVGSATVGLSGQESQVMKKTIPYCIAIVATVGVTAWLFTNLWFQGVP